MRKYLLLGILLGIAPLYAAAQEPPKLIFLGYHSIDSGEVNNYGYLGPSLNEAILKEISARFAFRQLPDAAWQRLAADNNLYPTDYHTKSVAINLGLLSKQDVVVSGFFTAKGNEISVETHIYDINQITEAKVIRSKMISNATLFKETDKMAKEIADQMATILPNKQDWQRRYAQIQTEALRLNSIGFEGGVAISASPAPLTSSLTPTAKLTPSDFTQLFGVRLGYMRHHFYREKFVLIASAAYLRGSNAYNTQFGAARGDLQEIAVSVGLGYHVVISHKTRVYFRTILQGGYGISFLSVDYSSVFPRPTDLSTQKSIDSQSLSYRFPLAEISVPIGINPLPAVSIEFVPRIQSFFFQDRVSLRAAFSLAAIVSF